jgi:hypothetical protein
LQNPCKYTYSRANSLPEFSGYLPRLLHGCCTQITLGSTRTCDPRGLEVRGGMFVQSGPPLYGFWSQASALRHGEPAGYALWSPILCDSFSFSKGMFESDVVASAGRTRLRPSRGGAQLARLPEALLRTHLKSLGSEKGGRPAVRDSPRL